MNGRVRPCNFMHAGRVDDPLFFDDDARRWSGFAAGHTVGGLCGVGWAYIMTQLLPYYS